MDPLLAILLIVSVLAGVFTVASQWIKSEGPKKQTPKVVLPSKAQLNWQQHMAWNKEFDALIGDELTLHVFDGTLVTTEEFQNRIAYQAWLDGYRKVWPDSKEESI